MKGDTCGFNTFVINLLVREWATSTARLQLWLWSMWICHWTGRRVI